MCATQKISRYDNFQYGGVLASVQNKLSQRYAGGGSDSMGRFNWMNFYGKNRFLRIYTVYRVCQGNDSSSGDDTAWTAQRTHLLEKNINCDPREHVVTTLLQSIEQDIKASRSIIVCADMNENIFSHAGITTKLEDIGLINIFKSLGQLSTPFRTCTGKHAIDGIWVSKSISHCIVRRGYSPFNFMIPSDHRGAFCDIDMRMILDNDNHNIVPAPYRRLKSQIPSRSRAYVHVVEDLWDAHKIDDKLNDLKLKFETEGPNAFTISSLNKLDNEIQSILNTGEKKCCKISRHCIHGWTPELEKAIRNKRQLKSQIMKASRNPLSTKLSMKTLLDQYKKNNRELRFQKIHSQSLRENLLDQLATDIMNDKPDKYREKASVLKQLKNCEQMKRDAEKIRKAVKGYRSSGIDHILIPARSSYTQKQTSPFDHYNVNTIWNRLQIANGKDVLQWERVEDPEKIEKYVIEFLKRHFGQASTTPLGNIYWMERLSDPDFQQDLLNGKYVYDNNLPKETNEILTTFSRLSDKEIPFQLTYEHFKTFIAKSKETTSASPSTRHYGHYKTLLTRSEHILQSIFSILSLSLKFGTILDRWKKTVTTLLCKDNNTPYIHRLRPIHIIEVELQFVSKCYWGKLLITHSENKGYLTDSQYGGRRSRQAQSSVLNSVLTFDYHRQLRLNFTYNDDDLRANYDRELSHFSAAETRQFGLAQQAGKFLVNTTKLQKYYIKTKLGTSKNFYTFSTSFPIWGLGQGVCWAGSCWQFTATTIEKCLTRGGQGAIFTSPDGYINTTRIIEFFIDDTKKICNLPSNNSLIEQSIKNMQLHTNLVLSTGGTLALDKCKFYYVSYAFDNNGNPKIQPIQKSPGAMQIKNNFTNESITIKRLEAHVAHRTLGYFIAPDGNTKKQTQELIDITTDWVQKIKQSNLQGYNIIRAYESILKPKIIYRLAAMMLTFEQCDKINRLSNAVILNAYGIQQHFPRSILESGHQYDGLNTIHFYDLHGIEKLKFFKYHTTRHDHTGKLIIISMQLTQLELGKATLFLNLNYDTNHQFTTTTWITHLWQYLSNRQLTVDMSIKSSLSLQRTNDAFLMDILASAFCHDDLLVINKIRIHLHLLFLSDVVDSDGKHLLPQIRLRKRYRKSHLIWPQQPWIKQWNDLWNQVCNYLQSYIVDNPLGRWKCAYFEWEAQLHESNEYIKLHNVIYRRNTSTTRKPKYTPTNLSATEFSNQAFKSADILISGNNIFLIAHTDFKYNKFAITPYSLNLKSEYNLFGGFTRFNESIIVNTIRSNDAKMCADGSVKDGKGSYAYCLAGKGSRILFSQHAPVHGYYPVSSTRAELFGILACVRYLHYLSTKYLFLKRHFVLITADNFEAVRASTKDLSSTKQTFLPNGDLIREIQYWTKVSSFHLRFQHVRGHQDNLLAFTNLSPLAKLNVKMDALAKQYFDEPINAPIRSNHTPFLQRDTVSYCSQYDRITANFQELLLQQYHGSNAEQQFKKTFSLNNSTLLLIDWNSFYSFIRSKKGQERFSLVKCIHKQWPVMKRQHLFQEADSPFCCLCSHEIETCDHVLQCSNLHSKLYRKQSIKSLKSSLYELQTDPFIVKHLIRMILQWSDGFDVSRIPTVSVQSNEVSKSEAINSQVQLGVPNLLRGLLSWKLHESQQTYYRTLPKKVNGDGSMWPKKVISMMVGLTMGCWKYRCEVLHSTFENTYEGRLRQKCKNFLHDLKRDNSSLHHKYHHLLERNKQYFDNVRISTLDSWMRRITLGIRKKLEEDTKSTNDIRHWMTKGTRTVPNKQKKVISNKTQNTSTLQNNPVTTEEYLLTPYIPSQLQLTEIQLYETHID